MQMECGFHKKNFILICLLLAMAAATNVHGHGMKVGFYSKTCPHAESIVRSTVQSYVSGNPALAAGLLRMHFHDCFVRGCDASVLISGSGTEKTAAPNLTLKGFEVVDDAKAKLEAACPGVVSCADILALAARDSVVLRGGRNWKVPTGRRDGCVSIASEVLSLPGPNLSVDQQKDRFAQEGLNLKDLVTLAGGHTLGTASCNSLRDRLYNFNGTGCPDRSINPSFLPRLQQQCPRNGDGSTRVALDTGSQNKFDTSYYANMKNGRGILHSDQVLWTDASTKRIVQKYLRVKGLFNVEFAKSMIKMSKIGVKTGSDGEIRKICSAIN